MEYYEAAENYYTADGEPTSAMDEEDSVASNAFTEAPVDSKHYPIPVANRHRVKPRPGSSGACSSSVAGRQRLIDRVARYHDSAAVQPINGRKIC